MGLQQAPRARTDAGSTDDGYKPESLDDKLDRAMGLGSKTGGVMLRREPGKLVVFSHLNPKATRRERARAEDRK
jgi:hypothetical protein